VARRVEYLDRYITYFHFFTILGDVGIEVRLSGRTENDGCTGFLGKIQVTGNEIRVEVSFQYIFDLSTVLCCPVYIRLCFAQWIDDNGFSFAFNVVSRFCQSIRYRFVLLSWW
jgi:hypothetical protein